MMGGMNQRWTVLPMSSSARVRARVDPMASPSGLACVVTAMVSALESVCAILSSVVLEV